MEYNFINPAMFIGLIGGGIPWGTIFFYGRHPHQMIATLIQVACMVVGLLNLLYGLFVILT